MHVKKSNLENYSFLRTNRQKTIFAILFPTGWKTLFYFVSHTICSSSQRTCHKVKQTLTGLSLGADALRSRVKIFTNSLVFSEIEFYIKPDFTRILWLEYQGWLFSSKVAKLETDFDPTAQKDGKVTNFFFKQVNVLLWMPVEVWFLVLNQTKKSFCELRNAYWCFNETFGANAATA